MNNKKQKKGILRQAVRREAARIADAEGMVRSLSRLRWEVASQSSPGSWHTIKMTAGGAKCKCPSHAIGDPCKHAAAVEILILRAVGAEMGVDPAVLEEADPRCPECTSTRVRKYGKLPSEDGDEIQKYTCNESDCGATFAEDKKTARGDYSRNTVLSAMSLLCMRIPTDEIATFFQMCDGLDLRDATVRRWARAYKKLVFGRAKG